MNKLIGPLLFILLVSCKKEVTTEVNTSFVSFINAVPDPSPTPSIFVDDVFQFSLPYSISYRNLQVTADAHILSVRDSFRNKILLTMPSDEFISNTSSTLLIYDTLQPIDSTVRGIRLFDDQTLPPAGFVKVRFLNAAPLVNATDVTFVRTDGNQFDSVTLSAQPYVGISQNVQTLSLFHDIPLGDYMLKIKAAGTQATLLSPIKLTMATLAGSARISGITTFYLTGGVRSRPLAVGAFRHYP